jgi:hypothetical protein
MALYLFVGVQNFFFLYLWDKVIKILSRIYLDMYDFSTKQCLESFITSDSERRAGIALY